MLLQMWSEIWLPPLPRRGRWPSRPPTITVALSYRPATPRSVWRTTAPRVGAFPESVPLRAVRHRPAGGGLSWRPLHLAGRCPLPLRRSRASDWTPDWRVDSLLHLPEYLRARTLVDVRASRPVIRKALTARVRGPDRRTLAKARAELKRSDPLRCIVLDRRCPTRRHRVASRRSRPMRERCRLLHRRHSPMARRECVELSCRAADYLTKPIQVTDLIVKLGQVRESRGPPRLACGSRAPSPRSSRFERASARPQDSPRES